jgi:hypothetical protein
MRLNKRAPRRQRAANGARRRATRLAPPPSRRRGRGIEARHPDMARDWSPALGPHACLGLGGTVFVALPFQVVAWLQQRAR